MIAHRIVKQMLCLLVGFLISASVLAADPVKIGCVGDRITFGAAIKDRENRNQRPGQRLLLEFRGRGLEVVES